MSCSVTTVFAPPIMDVARLGIVRSTRDRSSDDSHTVVPRPQTPAWSQPIAQLLPGGPTMIVEPPTKAEWESFQPMITELYKRKQYTARQIIDELIKHGFYASEKMLRDRFRAWEINNKNRNSKRSGADNVTAEHTALRSSIMDVVRLGGLTYPVRAAPTDAATRRSVTAVRDWYDHILDNRERAFSSWEEPCPMFNITHQFSVTLYGLKESNYKFGWKTLREIGSRIDNALLSSHSLSLIWLITNMITWKCGRPEIVDAVRRFWALRSREVLGARHPITIIVAALCHRAISEELIDEFFATINAKLSDDTDVSVQQLQVASQSQIVYAQILLALQQYAKADGILASLVIKTASSQAFIYLHPQVLRLQANSQKDQGNLTKADDLCRDTHAKLKECGKEATAVTSITLIDHAKVKDALGQLNACEELLHEALRIQLLCRDAAILQQPMALYHLHDVLRRTGQLEASESLEQRYPDAFERSGATKAVVE